MEHVLWIGGGPGAGKTTVATLLARRHGLRWYGADTRTWEHRDRALGAGVAAAHRWEAMDPADRWTKPSPDEMLAMSLHRERGTMVVDDLRALPTSPLVVAEGTTMPAWAAEPGRAVWLIPTREFQDRILDARSLAPGIAALYRLYADVVTDDAREHGVPVVAIDGSADVHEVAAEVERRFADALAAGPRAESLAERRALLREANTAIANQVRGFYARPWANGDPETVSREFLCECGDPACEAFVVATVGELASPALAPGH